MVKIDLKKSLFLALPVTFMVWLVGFVMLRLGVGVVSQLYVSIPATSVITPTLGAKCIAILGGFIPINWSIPAIVILYVSAVLTLFIGKFVIDLLGGKTFGNIFGLGADAGRVATYLMAGAAVAYMVIVGFDIPSRLTLLGVVIHTLAVSVGSVFIAKKFNFGL